MPRFEVRGLKTKADNVGGSTSFSHEATIVALGDSMATRKSYLVVFGVTRVSGGDPQNQRESNSQATVLAAALNYSPDRKLTFLSLDKAQRAVAAKLGFTV